MYRSYLLLFFVAMLSSLSMAKDVLDKPVSVDSFDDLDAICVRLKADLSGSDFDSLSQAITYLMAYVRIDYDSRATESEKTALLINLTNRKTPREIIVVGHLIWLERTRLALSKEERLSETDTDQPVRLRRNTGEANQLAALAVIRRYLTREIPGNQ
jgi:hypothetical protein